MIENVLYEALKTVNQRIYPLLLPQKCTYPALVYTIVNDADEQSFNGEFLGKNTRIQVDVYDLSYIGAKNTKNAVIEAIYPLGAIEINVQDFLEEDTQLFRQLIDFRIRS